jgi:hypothetical protein
MLIVCFRQFWSTREIQSAQARNGRKIVVWPINVDRSTISRLVSERRVTNATTTSRASKTEKKKSFSRGFETMEG